MQSSQVRNVGRQISEVAPLLNNDCGKEALLWLLKDASVLIRDWFSNEAQLIRCTKEYVSKLTRWRNCKNEKLANILKGYLKRIMMNLQSHINYMDQKFLLSELEEELIQLTSLYLDLELRVWPVWLKMKQREAGDSVSGGSSVAEQRKVDQLLHWLYTMLPSNANRVDALLSLVMVYNPNSKGLLDPIFRKVLNELESGPLPDVSYVRYLLFYKLWNERVRLVDDETTRALRTHIISSLHPVNTYAMFSDELRSCLPYVRKDVENVAEFHLSANIYLKKSCTDFLKCRRTQFECVDVNVDRIAICDGSLDIFNCSNDEVGDIMVIMESLKAKRESKSAMASCENVVSIDLTEEEPKASTSQPVSEQVIDLTEEDEKPPVQNDDDCVYIPQDNFMHKFIEDDRVSSNHISLMLNTYPVFVMVPDQNLNENQKVRRKVDNRNDRTYMRRQIQKQKSKDAFKSERAMNEDKMDDFDDRLESRKEMMSRVQNIDKQQKNTSGDECDSVNKLSDDVPVNTSCERRCKQDLLKTRQDFVCTRLFGSLNEDDLDEEEENGMFSGDLNNKNCVQHVRFSDYKHSGDFSAIQRTCNDKSALLVSDPSKPWRYVRPKNVSYLKNTNILEKNNPDNHKRNLIRAIPIESLRSVRFNDTEPSLTHPITAKVIDNSISDKTSTSKERVTNLGTITSKQSKETYICPKVNVSVETYRSSVHKLLDNRLKFKNLISKVTKKSLSQTDNVRLEENIEKSQKLDNRLHKFTFEDVPQVTNRISSSKQPENCINRFENLITVMYEDNVFPTEVQKISEEHVETSKKLHPMKISEENIIEILEDDLHVPKETQLVVQELFEGDSSVEEPLKVQKALKLTAQTSQEIYQGLFADVPQVLSMEHQNSPVKTSTKQVPKHLELEMQTSEEDTQEAIEDVPQVSSVEHQDSPMKTSTKQVSKHLKLMQTYGEDTQKAMEDVPQVLSVEHQDSHVKTSTKQVPKHLESMQTYGEDIQKTIEDVPQVLSVEYQDSPVTTSTKQVPKHLELMQTYGEDTQKAIEDVPQVSVVEMENSSVLNDLELEMEASEEDFQTTFEDVLQVSSEEMKDEISKVSKHSELETQTSGEDIQEAFELSFVKMKDDSVETQTFEDVPQVSSVEIEEPNPKYLELKTQTSGEDTQDIFEDVPQVSSVEIDNPNPKYLELETQTSIEDIQQTFEDVPQVSSVEIDDPNPKHLELETQTSGEDIQKTFEDVHQVSSVEIDNPNPIHLELETQTCGEDTQKTFEDVPQVSSVDIDDPIPKHLELEKQTSGEDIQETFEDVPQIPSVNLDDPNPKYLELEKHNSGEDPQEAFEISSAKMKDDLVSKILEVETQTFEEDVSQVSSVEIYDPNPKYLELETKSGEDNQTSFENVPQVSSVEMENCSVPKNLELDTQTSEDFQTSCGDVPQVYNMEMEDCSSVKELETQITRGDIQETFEDAPQVSIVEMEESSSVEVFEEVPQVSSLEMESPMETCKVLELKTQTSREDTQEVFEDVPQVSFVEMESPMETCKVSNDLELETQTYGEDIQTSFEDIPQVSSVQIEDNLLPKNQETQTFVNSQEAFEDVPQVSTSEMITKDSKTDFIEDTQKLYKDDPQIILEKPKKQPFEDDPQPNDPQVSEDVLQVFTKKILEGVVIQPQISEDVQDTQGVIEDDRQVEIPNCGIDDVAQITFKNLETQQLFEDDTQVYSVETSKLTIDTKLSEESVPKILSKDLEVNTYISEDVPQVLIQPLKELELGTQTSEEKIISNLDVEFQNCNQVINKPFEEVPQVTKTLNEPVIMSSEKIWNENSDLDQENSEDVIQTISLIAEEVTQVTKSFQSLDISLEEINKENLDNEIPADVQNIIQTASEDVIQVTEHIAQNNSDLDQLISIDVQKVLEDVLQLVTKEVVVLDIQYSVEDVQNQEKTCVVEISQISLPSDSVVIDEDALQSYQDNLPSEDANQQEISINQTKISEDVSQMSSENIYKQPSEDVVQELSENVTNSDDNQKQLDEEVPQVLKTRTTSTEITTNVDETCIKSPEGCQEIPSECEYEDINSPEDFEQESSEDVVVRKQNLDIPHVPQRCEELKHSEEVVFQPEYINNPEDEPQVSEISGKNAPKIEETLKENVIKDKQICETNLQVQAVNSTEDDDVHSEISSIHEDAYEEDIVTVEILPSSENEISSEEMENEEKNPEVDIEEVSEDVPQVTNLGKDKEVIEKNTKSSIEEIIIKDSDNSMQKDNNNTLKEENKTVDCEEIYEIIIENLNETIEKPKQKIIEEIITKEETPGSSLKHLKVEKQKSLVVVCEQMNFAKYFAEKDKPVYNLRKSHRQTNNTVSIRKTNKKKTIEDNLKREKKQKPFVNKVEEQKKYKELLKNEMDSFGFSKRKSPIGKEKIDTVVVSEETINFLLVPEEETIDDSCEEKTPEKINSAIFSKKLRKKPRFHCLAVPKKQKMEEKRSYFVLGENIKAKPNKKGRNAIQNKHSIVSEDLILSSEKKTMSSICKKEINEKQNCEDNTIIIKDENQIIIAPENKKLAFQEEKSFKIEENTSLIVSKSEEILFFEEKQMNDNSVQIEESLVCEKQKTSAIVSEEQKEQSLVSDNQEAIAVVSEEQKEQSIVCDNRDSVAIVLEEQKELICDSRETAIVLEEQNEQSSVCDNQETIAFASEEQIECSILSDISTDKTLNKSDLKRTKDTLEDLEENVNVPIEQPISEKEVSFLMDSQISVLKQKSDESIIEEADSHYSCEIIIEEILEDLITKAQNIIENKEESIVNTVMEKLIVEVELQTIQNDKEESVAIVLEEQKDSLVCNKQEAAAIVLEEQKEQSLVYNKRKTHNKKKSAAIVLEEQKKQLLVCDKQESVAIVLEDQKECSVFEENKISDITTIQSDLTKIENTSVNLDQKVNFPIEQIISEEEIPFLTDNQISVRIKKTGEQIIEEINIGNSCEVIIKEILEELITKAQNIFENNQKLIVSNVMEKIIDEIELQAIQNDNRKATAIVLEDQKEQALVCDEHETNASDLEEQKKHSLVCDNRETTAIVLEAQKVQSVVCDKRKAVVIVSEQKEHSSVCDKQEAVSIVLQDQVDQAFVCDKREAAAIVLEEQKQCSVLEESITPNKSEDTFENLYEKVNFPIEQTVSEEEVSFLIDNQISVPNKVTDEPIIEDTNTDESCEVIIKEILEELITKIQNIFENNQESIISTVMENIIHEIELQDSKIAEDLISKKFENLSMKTPEITENFVINTTIIDKTESRNDFEQEQSVFCDIEETVPTVLEEQKEQSLVCDKQEPDTFVLEEQKEQSIVYNKRKTHKKKESVAVVLEEQKEQLLDKQESAAIVLEEQKEQLVVYNKRKTRNKKESVAIVLEEQKEQSLAYNKRKTHNKKESVAIVLQEEKEPSPVCDKQESDTIVLEEEKEQSLVYNKRKIHNKKESVAIVLQEEKEQSLVCDKQESDTIVLEEQKEQSLVYNKRKIHNKKEAFVLEEEKEQSIVYNKRKTRNKKESVPIVSEEEKQQPIVYNKRKTRNKKESVAIVSEEEKEQSLVYNKRKTHKNKKESVAIVLKEQKEKSIVWENKEAIVLQQQAVVCDDNREAIVLQEQAVVCDNQEKVAIVLEQQNKVENKIEGDSNIITEKITDISENLIMNIAMEKIIDEIELQSIQNDFERESKFAEDFVIDKTVFEGPAIAKLVECGPYLEERCLPLPLETYNFKEFYEIGQAHEIQAKCSVNGFQKTNKQIVPRKDAITIIEISDEKTRDFICQATETCNSELFSAEINNCVVDLTPKPIPMSNFTDKISASGNNQNFNNTTDNNMLSMFATFVCSLATREQFCNSPKRELNSPRKEERPKGALIEDKIQILKSKKITRDENVTDLLDSLEVMLKNYPAEAEMTIPTNSFDLQLSAEDFDDSFTPLTQNVSYSLENGIVKYFYKPEKTKQPPNTEKIKNKNDLSEILSLANVTDKTDKKIENKVEESKVKNKTRLINKEQMKVLLNKYKKNESNNKKQTITQNNSSPYGYIRSTRPTRMVTKRKQNTITEESSPKKPKTDELFDKLLEEHKKDTSKNMPKLNKSDSSFDSTISDDLPLIFHIAKKPNDSLESLLDNKTKIKTKINKLTTEINLEETIDKNKIGVKQMKKQTKEVETIESGLNKKASEKPTVVNEIYQQDDNPFKIGKIFSEKKFSKKLLKNTDDENVNSEIVANCKKIIKKYTGKDATENISEKQNYEVNNSVPEIAIIGKTMDCSKKQKMPVETISQLKSKKNETIEKTMECSKKQKMPVETISQLKSEKNETIEKTTEKASKKQKTNVETICNKLISEQKETIEKAFSDNVGKIIGKLPKKLRKISENCIENVVKIGSEKVVKKSRKDLEKNNISDIILIEDDENSLGKTNEKVLKKENKISEILPEKIVKIEKTIEKTSKKHKKDDLISSELISIEKESSDILPENVVENVVKIAKTNEKASKKQKKDSLISTEFISKTKEDSVILPEKVVVENVVKIDKTIEKASKKHKKDNLITSEIVSKETENLVILPEKALVENVVKNVKINEKTSKKHRKDSTELISIEKDDFDSSPKKVVVENLVKITKTEKASKKHRRDSLIEVISVEKQDSEVLPEKVVLDHVVKIDKTTEKVSKKHKKDSTEVISKTKENSNILPEKVIVENIVKIDKTIEKASKKHKKDPLILSEVKITKENEIENLREETTVKIVKTMKKQRKNSDNQIIDIEKTIEKTLKKQKKESDSFVVETIEDDIVLEKQVEYFPKRRSLRSETISNQILDDDDNKKENENLIVQKPIRKRRNDKAIVNLDEALLEEGEGIKTNAKQSSTKTKVKTIETETKESETVDATKTKSKTIDAETVYPTKTKSKTIERETKVAETVDGTKTKSKTIETETVDATKTKSKTIERETKETETVDAIKTKSKTIETETVEIVAQIDSKTNENNQERNSSAVAVVEKWFNNTKNQIQPETTSVYYEELTACQNIEDCHFFEENSNSSEISHNTSGNEVKNTVKLYSEYQTPDSGIAFDEDSVNKEKLTDANTTDQENFTDNEIYFPKSSFSCVKYSSGSEDYREIPLVEKEIKIVDETFVAESASKSLMVSIKLDRLTDILPLLKKKKQIKDAVDKKEIEIDAKIIKKRKEAPESLKEHKIKKRRHSSPVESPECNVDWSSEEVMSPSSTTQPGLMCSTPERTNLMTKGTRKEYSDFLFGITASPVPSTSCCINSHNPSDISHQDGEHNLAIVYEEGGIDLCTDLYQYYESFDSLKEQQSLQAGYCVTDSQFTVTYEHANDEDIFANMMDKDMIAVNMNVLQPENIMGRNVLTVNMNQDNINKNMIVVNMNELQPIKSQNEDEKKGEFEDMDTDNNISGVVDGICRNLDNDIVIDEYSQVEVNTLIEQIDTGVIENYEHSEEIVDSDTLLLVENVTSNENITPIYTEIVKPINKTTPIDLNSSPNIEASNKIQNITPIDLNSTLNIKNIEVSNKITHIDLNSPPNIKNIETKTNKIQKIMPIDLNSPLNIKNIEASNKITHIDLNSPLNIKNMEAKTNKIQKITSIELNLPPNVKNIEAKSNKIEKIKSDNVCVVKKSSKEDPSMFVQVLDEPNVLKEDKIPIFFEENASVDDRKINNDDTIAKKIIKPSNKVCVLKKTSKEDPSMFVQVLNEPNVLKEEKIPIFFEENTSVDDRKVNNDDKINKIAIVVEEIVSSGLSSPIERQNSERKVPFSPKNIKSKPKKFDNSFEQEVPIKQDKKKDSDVVSTIKPSFSYLQAMKSEEDTCKKLKIDKKPIEQKKESSGFFDKIISQNFGTYFHRTAFTIASKKIREDFTVKPRKRKASDEPVKSNNNGVKRKSEESRHFEEKLPNGLDKRHKLCNDQPRRFPSARLASKLSSEHSPKSDNNTPVYKLKEVDVPCIKKGKIGTITSQKHLYQQKSQEKLINVSPNSAIYPKKTVEYIANEVISEKITQKCLERSPKSDFCSKKLLDVRKSKSETSKVSPRSVGGLYPCKQQDVYCYGKAKSLINQTSNGRSKSNTYDKCHSLTGSRSAPIYQKQQLESSCNGENRQKTASTSLRLSPRDRTSDYQLKPLKEDDGLPLSRRLVGNVSPLPPKESKKDSGKTWLINPAILDTVQRAEVIFSKQWNTGN